jgi:hypothetical protein
MHNSFSIKEQVEKYVSLQQGLLDYDHGWTLSTSGLLNIYNDLIESDFERIIKHGIPIKSVQFALRFSVNEKTLKLLNDAVFVSQDEALFRVILNGCGAFDDLNFLKHLPNLKGFGFRAMDKVDISPIVDFVKLKNLGLAGGNISLKAIEGYKSLTSFGFGDKIKNLEVISSFSNLENLGVSGKNLKNLEFIVPLKNLKRISFSLGGTSKLNELSKVANLEDVDIWRTRKLTIEDLTPLNEISGLKVLKLRQLPNITHFNWLQNPSLQCLFIQNLKGLKSYETLKNIHTKTLIISDKLDETKIESIGHLNNIESIQINKWYLEKYAHLFSKLTNKDKITEMELQYLMLEY